jgi:hypothetical protein
MFKKILIAALALTIIAGGMAFAKGGDTGSTTTGSCVSISLPKPVESINLAGKTDWTVQLQTKISSCTGGSYLIDIAEVYSYDPDAQLGTPYEGCALPNMLVGPFVLKAGETRTFSFTTPPLPLPVCTHLLRETLRDSTTGQTWGPVIQRINSTTRI